jgi:methionine aminotransferase
MNRLRTKLPNLATTIFTKMSALSAQYNAINLSQGFPNFDCDAHLQQLCCDYIQKGFNQYAPMAGLLALRQVLSQKIARLYGQEYDKEAEITITSGATQAIYTAITALVHSGDEVIIIEPAYDCYRPAIELCGATVVPYSLRAEQAWRIDWAAFGQLISSKTSMIIINTPHNPTGSVWGATDMEQLQTLVENTDIIILSDEVYEHLTFDNRRHYSILGYPALRQRSLATFSFGKTLHATGWKLGYIVGDAALMAEFRKVHQFNVFSANTPLQYAIADYLQNPTTYEQLPQFFEQKRDTFLTLLADKTPLRWLPCEGTYFQVADYSAISKDVDTDFAVWLTQHIGVAVIPLSVFYSAPPQEQKLIRICFAKTDDTLKAAAERLAKL